MVLPVCRALSRTVYLVRLRIKVLQGCEISFEILHEQSRRQNTLHKMVDGSSEADPTSECLPDKQG